MTRTFSETEMCRTRPVTVTYAPPAFRSSGDIFRIAAMLRNLDDFASRNAADGRNREQVKEMSHYFAWRAELLRTPCFRRVLSISVHPLRQLDHFRCGFGFRSMIRDLIARTDKPDR